MAYTSAKVINACLMHDNTHTPSVQSLSHQSTDFHQPLRQPWWRPLAELAVFVATYIPALLIFVGVFMGLAWAMGLDESIVNLETMDHPWALAGGLGSLKLMILAALLAARWGSRRTSGFPVVSGWVYQMGPHVPVLGQCPTDLCDLFGAQPRSI